MERRVWRLERDVGVESESVVWVWRVRVES